MREGIIYGLICPRTNRIRYIGQTVQTAKDRLAQHIRQYKAKTTITSRKEAWFRSLDNAGLLDQIRIEVLEQLDSTLLSDAELKWVLSMKESHDLTNGLVDTRYYPGPRTQPAKTGRYSLETLMRMRECKLGTKNPMFGKHVVMTDDQRKKLSQSLRTSTRFQESRGSDAYRKQASDRQSRGVILLDIRDQSTKVFRNCREVAEYLGCTYANIKTARRSGRLVYKTYRVMYSSDYAA